MKTETSIIRFEHEYLQQHLKILSIKGKIRNKWANKFHPLEFTKFHFDVDSVFKGVPYQFSIHHLTEDEFILTDSSITEPIVFKSDNTLMTAKCAFYQKKKGQPESDENYTFINSFKSGELERLLFDAVYAYYKQSNQYKLANTFFNTN